MGLKCQIVEIHAEANRISVFLIKMGCIVFVVLMILSNNAFAQPPTLHDQTLDEIVKQSPGLDEKSGISVGDGPTAITVSSGYRDREGTKYLDRAYIVNTDSDSISIISAHNNTKIGPDIPVGDEPTAITVSSEYDGDTLTDTVFVANTGSDSISIISNITENSTPKVQNISVGDEPYDIAVSEGTGNVYVSNSLSNSISIISNITENSTQVKAIEVKFDPEDILIYNDYTSSGTFVDRLYLVNTYTGGLSTLSVAGNNLSKVENISFDREEGVHRIAVSERTGAYVATDSGVISKVSVAGNGLSKVENIANVGKNPSAIAVSPNSYNDEGIVTSDNVYVISGGSDKVSIFLTSRRIHR